MSNGRMSTHVDPEDMFADTRMSFGDHLEELRTHLWRAIKGFILAMILALCFGNYVVKFITIPVTDQLERHYQRAARQRYRELMAKARNQGTAATESIPVWVNLNTLRDQLGMNQLREQMNELRKDLKLPPLPKQASEPVLGATIQAFEGLLADLEVADYIDRTELGADSSRIKLTLHFDAIKLESLIALDSIKNSPQKQMATMNITEAFMVYFKVSLVTGLVIGSPWIFYQIWMFIAAGLYPHEKRLVNVYLPFSLALFLAGAAICQFLVMPKAIEVLLSFNEWMGLEPDLRLNEWLSFALWLPVIFGISFQTPLVMHFLFKIGIADVSTFRSYRKIAWFLMAIFAAVITPTPDAMTMLYLWVPMGLLYELGILMCAMQPRTPFEEVETPETEEMVEV